MGEDDVEAEETGSEEEPDVEVAELGGLLVELFPSSSSPSSLPSSSSLVLLRSSENVPASRCCSTVALGSVEFGEVTPNAQIKD